MARTRRGRPAPLRSLGLASSDTSATRSMLERIADSVPGRPGDGLDGSTPSRAPNRIGSSRSGERQASPDYVSRGFRRSYGSAFDLGRTRPAEDLGTVDQLFEPLLGREEMAGQEL